MASVAIDGRDRRAQRDFPLLIPASEIVVTSFMPAARRESSPVPTLASVERVVGKLAGVGLMLEDPSQLQKIAEMINARFLSVPSDCWSDVELPLSVRIVEGAGPREATGAISAIRKPTLEAVDPILLAEARQDPRLRREAEALLVDELSSSVAADRGVWERRSVTIGRFLGLTVLSGLTAQLVGVPLADLIRAGVRGALQRV